MIRGMEKKPYPSETQERFIVRFPDGMRDRIAEEAKKNNRSMNAEIVARLEQSLAGEIGEDRQIEINALLKGLRDTIAEIGRTDIERENAMRSLGDDLHKLFNGAIPAIEDEKNLQSILRRVGDVGMALQAGDITDAQAQLRAIYYLAKDYALGVAPKSE